MGVAVLLGLHGAIHLFGFLKWSKLARVPQLGGRQGALLRYLGEIIWFPGA